MELSIEVIRTSQKSRGAWNKTPMAVSTCAHSVFPSGGRGPGKVPRSSLNARSEMGLGSWL